MKVPAFLYKNSLLLIVLVASLETSLVFAEKMDLVAHNLVIEKLESTLKSIPSNDQNINGLGLKLQLAHLYAEKARLLLVEEGQKGCQNCLGAKQTRQQAIALYKVILPHLKGSEADQVTLQLAHLLEATNKSAEALKLYNRLISKTSTTPAVLAQAHQKRGGNFFREARFDEALKDFAIVLTMLPNEAKGTTLHKIAWAQFNKGEVDLAITKLEQILQNEMFLMQPTDEGFQYSESFHSEVSHDLALFMAKDTISSHSLERLVQASPAADVIGNLLFLGNEAERAGQASGAPLAWERALNTKGFPDEKRMTVLVGLARFYRDGGHYTKATTYFADALSLSAAKFGKNFGSSKCEIECVNQAKALKQFLVQWDKQANKHSTPQKIHQAQMALIKAYQVYHQFQNADYETYLWLAQLSARLKQNEAARLAYSHAADLLASSSGTAKVTTLIESSLMAEIELAENSNNKNDVLASYEHYLKLNPQGKASPLVRFQRAKLYYDLNQPEKAFSLFDEIATEQRFPNADLKLKAAHLGLDALVILKNIELLETKGLDYSSRFPKNETDFHRISRNAGLQIVKSMAIKDASVASAEKALAKLEGVTLRGTQTSEAKAILRMKIDLSLKAQQWTKAQNSLSQYLEMADNGNNRADLQWALAKKLSLSELLLDFNQAYQTLLKLNYAQSKFPKDLLKAALIAELSRHDARPWLEKVIRSSQSSQQQKNLARAQLVRLSASPWKTLHQMASPLSTQPSLFANLALECFAENALLPEARWALGIKGVKGTVAGQMLTRFIALTDINKVALALRNQKLNSRSDSLLASSLKNRLKVLATVKAGLRQAQRHQDWTLQVVHAAILKTANQKLAVEIESLPTPKKLSEYDQQLYRKELLAQANLFKTTATELESYLEQSWQYRRYVNGLLSSIESSDRIRSVLMNELRSLAAVAPAGVVSDIQDKLTEFKNRPSNKEIAVTQLQLRKDPFDLELQSQLLGMEKKRGNQSMVVFLQARSNNIKGGSL
jgi:hypothetical protein